MQTVGHEDMTRVGPSYRQIDHWTRRGYLLAEGKGGQGHTRRWPLEERDVAAMMHRLVTAQIPPEVAHAIARSGGDHEVAPGIRVVVTPAS
jgi:hypothetical protein